jgi:phage baseplate assembly protein gpV
LTIEQTKTINEKVPDTTLKLLWRIIKGVFTNLSRTIIYQIIRTIIVFFLVLAVHTFLVVYVNEGFNAVPSQRFVHLMALEDYNTGAVVFWTFACFFISNLFSRVRKDGLFTFSKEMVMSPLYLGQCLASSQQTGLSLMLISAGAAILLSLATVNEYLILVFALIALFSFTLQKRSFLAYFFKVVRSDWQRLFLRNKPRKEAQQGIFSLMVFGIFLGLLISFFLPLKPYSSIGLFLVFIILSIMLRKKTVSTSTAIHSFLLITASALILDSPIVLAHDGGWTEAGGTFKDWLRSAGAFAAVTKGLIVAVCGAVGSTVGGLVGSIASGVGDLIKGIVGSSGNGANPQNDIPPFTTLNPDGSTTTYNPDGSITTTYPDGTTSDYTPPDDLPWTTLNPDGSSTTSGADGSTSTNPPESTQTTNPDGSVITTDQNGNKHTIMPDGTTVDYNAGDGSLTVNLPDGSTSVTTPDGTNTITDANGNKHTTLPDGTTVDYNSQDGSLTIHLPDGSTSVTTSDGTTTVYPPDNN